uniref:Uncharacterized protein ZK1073.1 n=1 Tax=Aceria tosichella TaxID=561515 RepID=A0A6G1S9U5_9ACAR
MASAVTESSTSPSIEARADSKQKDDVPGGGGETRASLVQAEVTTNVIRATDNTTTSTTTTTTTNSPPVTPSRAGGQVPIQSIPIETKYGIITAHVQGDLEQMENRGVFLTVHDIGSNSRAFLDFTEHPIMSAIRMRSLFIHVDLIGQQDNQQDLPDDYEFPPIKTIGEELLVEVLDKLKIKLIVGIGEGAGANILVRFANKYHSRVLGLVLIHLAPAGVGVLERLKSQISTGKRRFSEFSAENIVELHRLGDSSGRSGQSSPPPQSEQQQLMPLYKNRVNNMNAKNIKRYAISYMNRKELPLLKDMDILLVAGSRSPYLNGTQKYFAQCDKEKTSFLKVDHVVDVLTEAPEKLAKSILLFVKGLGFLTSLTLPGIDRQRTLSGSSQGSNDESGATMGPVPNIKPHRILERRRTLSMEEYDMPRPRRLSMSSSIKE